jgi:hypothetical protein
LSGPHNRFPRLDYRLPQMPNRLLPPDYQMPQLFSGLPARKNRLLKMDDYLSHALD